jgi:hypothetical protein
VSRTWATESLFELIDEIRATGFSQVSERTLLFAELREEIEDLVKCAYRHMDIMERRKFYSALRCWAVRNERTPSDKSTWGEWFERMYGEPLAAYAERAAKEGIRKKVLEYELATSGKSPLEDEKEKAA